MGIKNSKILILGGSGLVGRTVAATLLYENPAVIIIHSKTEEETKTALKELIQLREPAAVLAEGTLLGQGSLKSGADKTRPQKVTNRNGRVVTSGHVDLLGEWGDLFDVDFLSPLTPRIIKNAYLYKLIRRNEPDIIIDAVNTATAIAYQNLYEKSREVLTDLKHSGRLNNLKKSTSQLLASLYIPKLVRHIQILNEAMKAPEAIPVAASKDRTAFREPREAWSERAEPSRRDRIKLYLKIGTTGTGGMGFNIPFTHGEEKPSRMLLSKSAIAGAHSQLLYLLSQTPGMPRVIELKPATAIAWGKIGYGSVKNLPLKDSTEITELKIGRLFNGGGEVPTGINLVTSYIDSGENGLFSPEEFRALTDPSQMGFITPQEVAALALKEIRGIATAKNAVETLEKSVLGPSEKSQNKRSEAFAAVKKASQGREESPALGFLGPPRLTKLLFEARLIKITFSRFINFSETDEKTAASMIDAAVVDNESIRKFAVTMGIPILLKSGAEVVCGRSFKIPEFSDDRKITKKKVDLWAERGWIDLRISNLKLWRERLNSFRTLRNREPQFEGELAAFIFETEDGGFRKLETPTFIPAQETLPPITILPLKKKVRPRQL